MTTPKTARASRARSNTTQDQAPKTAAGTAGAIGPDDIERAAPEPRPVGARVRALWARWSNRRATRDAAPVSPTPSPTSPPPDPFNSPEVRAAIHRKAQALALDAFTHNCAILENWLRQCGDVSDPAAAIERIHTLQLDHGKHVMVDIQLLWDLAGCAMSAHRSTEIAMMAVARMESAMGRTLTTRGQS